MRAANPRGGPASRRDFLKVSSAAALAGAADLALPPPVHAGGSDVLRVGLVGCGGRGTGAATQALAADKHVALVAMADAFADRLRSSLATLRKDEAVGSKVKVPEDR